MASLTIRKLDEAIKAELRLRAASNGRSVEDEVRVILREARRAARCADVAAEPAPHAQSARREARRTSDAARHPDHRRRHRRLQGARSDPAAEGARIHVRCVLTRAAQQFVTPLSAGALSDERCYTDLFDPGSEFDAGHIRLARDCDLIVVAPATADLMAKMAHGHADDLATAILLAADRPILLAPAMNPLMWNNAATRRNVAQLARDGVAMVGPECRRDGGSR